MKITTSNATETRWHHFSTEASDLGLPPGDFPERLETDLGNKEPFLRTEVTPNGATYWQNHGCLTLMVFND